MTLFAAGLQVIKSNEVITTDPNTSVLMQRENLDIETGMHKGKAM